MTGRRWLRLLRRLALAALGLGLVAALAFWALWIACPFPEADLARPQASTRVLAADGTELRLTLGAGEQVRLTVRLDQVSPWFRPALVAAEDRRFDRHPGVDVWAAGRALAQNLWRGERFSGASTLTMQVIRQMEGRPRSWSTKLYECFRALQLERIRSKDQILAEYVNRAPFGSNLVGVEAAARRYFGVPAADLTLGQAALLAGLVQAPTRLDPVRHPERARTRREYVLARMQAAGTVTAAEAATAAAEPLPARLLPLPFVAPHFTERVLARRRPGGEVRTTLDPRLQAVAERALRERVAELAPSGVEGGAVIVVENGNGAVRALVGSPDFRARRGEVDGTAAARAPGSALKPFLYAQAIDEGRVTPATAVFDVPGEWREYAPANYAPRFLGPVPAAEALRQSLNLPAVRLLAQVGVGSWAGTLRALGLAVPADAERRDGLGLALGSCPVTLADLAGAYAALARGGRILPLSFLEGATPAEGRRVFSPQAAWLVLEILAREPLPDFAASPAAGGGAAASPEIAWKTGTSHGLHDAWTFAVCPRLTVGVWLGNPTGRPAAVLVGREAAAPVAGRILSAVCAGDAAAAPGARAFARPAGIAVRRVCRASGAPAGPHCPETVEDLFVPGVSDAAACPVHQAITVDAATGVEVCRRCRGDRAVNEVVIERWPGEVDAFLRAAGAPGVRAPRHDPACPGGRRDRAALAVVSPPDGQVYRLVAGAPGLSQRVPLSVGGAHGDVYWFVDGRLFGSRPAGEALWWPLSAGDHVIECVDASGGRGASRVRVE